MLIAVTLLFALICLIWYAHLEWEKYKQKYYEKRNIKYFNPGGWGAFFKKYSSSEFVQLFYQGLPDEPVAGTFTFRTPRYILRDPAIIKQIAVKNFSHFEDHGSFADEKLDKLLGKWHLQNSNTSNRCKNDPNFKILITLGNNLFMLKGAKWRSTRALVSPAFTGNKMRQMFELVVDSTDDIVKKLLKQAENGERINLEMKDFFSRVLVDSIALCAFGLKVDSISEPNNEFFTNTKLAIDLTSLKQFFKFTILSCAPFIAKVFGISLLDKSVARTFRNTVLDTMEIRKEKNIIRPDMINMMMELREGKLKHQLDEKTKEKEGFAMVEESEIGQTSVNRTLNDDELVAQCFIFLAGGFDTTSTMLVLTAYELMINQDIQQRLYEEIAEMDHQLGGKRINYDALQRMKYLDQVVCESLRKWPPAGQVDRVCVKDYVLQLNKNVNVNIEKGSRCVLPIYGIHHDPKYFPDPEKFDPDRFNDENEHNIVSGTYIPFGIGPRNCIGSRFALMEIKAVLYYFLLNFSFDPNEKSEIPLKLKKTPMINTPENGLHLEMKLRKK